MAGLSTNAPGLWGGFAGLLYGSTSLSTPPGFLADATPAWVLPGAALDLYFAESLGYNSRNLATTTPDSILTYTAPSPKMVYGSDGVLRYAPHNLLTYSEQFDNAAWGKSNSSVAGASINAIVAPNGTLTADKLVEGVGTARKYIAQSGASANQTFSLYAQKGERNYVAIGHTNLGGLWAVSLFDLNLGTYVNSYQAGGEAVPTNNTITPVGDSWYRISCTLNGSALMTASVIMVSNGGDPIFEGYTGNGTSGIYIWGAQLQRTPNHSSTYIPTTSAAVYSLPIDHNPTTFEPLGVLIEEQRTNLCLYSDDFTNAAWVKSNLTAAKTATGPDAVANSASTLTATAANATARQNVTSASAARITSMFVKRRTGTGAVYLSQGGTTGSELVVNGTFPTNTTGWTASGATLAVVSSELEVTNTGAAAGIADSDAFATVVGTAYLVGYTARRGTSSSVGIEVRTTSGSAETSITLTNTSNVDGFLYFIASTTSTFIRVSSNQAVLGRTGYFDNLSVKAAVETTVTVTSDWTRVATASATITNPPLIIRMATSGDAIDVALFQHELGAFITSPIPTVASQVTRLADQVSILTSAFAYNAAAGTVYAEADSYNINGTTWSLSDGTNNERIVSLTGIDYHLGVFDNGVQQAAIDVGTIPTNGTQYKGAAAFAADGFGFSLNGGTVGTAPAGTIPTVTSLRLGMGASTTTVQIGGHIKRLTYFPTRRSNADLQVLST